MRLSGQQTAQQKHIGDEQEEEVVEEEEDVHEDDLENRDEDKAVGAYVCGQGGEHEGWGGPPHIRQEQMLALPEWYKHRLVEHHAWCTH